mmetsp:Transcript_11738/g.17500  ORF Transcript_11738/g.17500 Transcript_11738/m.17500 type:complete len:96 (+) Transcript_11738:296-583(+)
MMQWGDEVLAGSSVKTRRTESGSSPHTASRNMAAIETSDSNQENKNEETSTTEHGTLADIEKILPIFRELRTARKFPKAISCPMIPCTEAFRDTS